MPKRATIYPDSLNVRVGASLKEQAQKLVDVGEYKSVSQVVRVALENMMSGQVPENSTPPA